MAGAWRSSDKVRAKQIQAGRLARLLDRHEHDRLARQPDGPRAPRDRDPRVLRAIPGVFSGWAGHRRRHHVSLARRAGSSASSGCETSRRSRRSRSPCSWIEALCLHARWQADRRGPVGYVDRDLGCAPDELKSVPREEPRVKAVNQTPSSSAATTPIARQSLKYPWRRRTVAGRCPNAELLL